ncbi:MAG: Skp-like protein [Parachlamydiales bacterium]|nr:Skp-like protein [Parachlamydiales bacterium]
MFLRKYLPWVAAACGVTFSLSAADATSVVNFSTCITNSKYGKKEQENFESLRKQLSSLIDDTEKELKDLSAKFEDSEYLDSLSPKAEEEMKARFQTLNEDLSRYQGQFYQVMQQAQMQLVHKMSAQITRASEKVAKDKKLDYVINKEACFYYRPDLELTQQVISEMDKNFDVDSKSKKLSDNSEEQPDENAGKETSDQHAG